MFTHIFPKRTESEESVRLKNGWNDIPAVGVVGMQTLFLYIVFMEEKLNNWNTFTFPPLVDATARIYVFLNN
jgi:hypothetical protein